MPCKELFLLHVNGQGEVGCLLPSGARPGKVLIIRYRLHLAILPLHTCLIHWPTAVLYCTPRPD